MPTKSSAESSLLSLSPRSSSRQHHCYRNSAAAASFIIFIVYHLRYLRFTSHSKVRIQGSPERAHNGQIQIKHSLGRYLLKNILYYENPAAATGSTAYPPVHVRAYIHTATNVQLPYHGKK